MSKKPLPTPAPHPDAPEVTMVANTMIQEYEGLIAGGQEFAPGWTHRTEGGQLIPVAPVLHLSGIARAKQLEAEGRATVVAQSAKTPDLSGVNASARGGE